MVKKIDTPAEINNKLEEIMEAGISRKMDRIVAAVQPRLRDRQKMFFQVLAQKIIGARAAPDLGEFTPEWAPLTAAYRAYRLKKKGVAGGRFYEYRSRKGDEGKTSLKDLLASARPETSFGAPLAFKSKKAALGRIRNTITVSPFPKVVESLQTAQIDEKSYLRSTNRGIAWRLRNFKGSRLRPILQPFMLWWMNYEMRKIVLEEVAKA